MRRWGIIVGIACACAAAPVCAADERGTSRSGAAAIVDTHAHLVRNRRTSPSAAAAQALRTMDELGVALTVLLPPPFPPNHPGTYGRVDLAGVVQAHPGRFAFVAGGESLNPMIHDISPEHVAPEQVRRFQREARQILEAGAIGFGELTAEHFSSGRGGHPYESTRPDHPLLLALADIAAESGAPIDLHMEAVPRDMEMPERLRRGLNPERLRENISGFERLLAHNRAARIVWAHCGWDLTGERTVALMGSLLTRHPNLYMSIKIDPHGPQRSAPFTAEGTLRPEWIELFRAFPDRFTIGSDQFFDDGSERVAQARRLVDALPDDVAPLIASENFKRIYRALRQDRK